MGVAAVTRTERVEAVLRQAAQATGVDFAYLLRTAKRESSLNPAAKARTSSAAGLFQFIEQTWLGTLKKHGAKHGYGRLAEAVQRGADGRLTVKDPAVRQRILDLRYDAKASALMGAELASDHAAYLRGRIGREPNAGELYVAHFLGPAGSAKLIQAAERSPDSSAARLFPAAASANRPIFYGKGGARSVGEVYAKLTGTPSSPAPAPPAPAPAPLLADVQIAATTPSPSLSAGVRDPLASARARLERGRTEAMLIDMILGDQRSSTALASPFSPELLGLLTSQRG
jgi:hypothetical protein